MPCAIHPEIVTGLTTCSRCNKQFCPNCIITLRGAPVCAGCKGAMVQDVKSGTVDGELDLAGRGARLGGALIDGLVMVVPIIIVVALLVGVTVNQESKQVDPLLLILLEFVFPVLLVTAYEGWMLSAFNGQTLGKKALGIRVVSADGSPVTAKQAWGRGLARTLMQLTRILGLIDTLMIFSKPRTTLHDRIAKTRVVRAKA